MQTRIAAHATTLCGTVTGVLQLIMIAIMLTDAAQGTYGPTPVFYNLCCSYSYFACMHGHTILYL